MSSSGSKAPAAAVPDEVQETVYSMERMAKNNANLYKIRQFTAILAGCIVGLMGWTGLAGFLAYLEICVVVSLYLAYRLNFKTTQYFTSRSDLLGPSAVTSGMLSFILFWTLVYDSIWIF
eukprot:EG_transcript_35580